MKIYLQNGGSDGSFSYITGPDEATPPHNPGDDLTPYNISWSYVFQGEHETTGGYVDTLDFNPNTVLPNPHPNSIKALPSLFSSSLLPNFIAFKYESITVF